MVILLITYLLIQLLTVIKPMPDVNKVIAIVGLVLWILTCLQVIPPIRCLTAGVM